MELTKTFELKNGKTVTMTGKLITRKTHYADGANVEVDCCEIYTDITVEGMGTMSGGISALTKIQQAKLPAGYTHQCDRIAMTAAQYDLWRSIIDTLHATPEWQAKIAAEKQAAEIEKQQAETDAKNGLCPRCQTYCHGGCTA